MTEGEYFPADFYEYSVDLSVLLQIDIDLVDLRKATTVMKNEIINYGQVIYAINNKALDRFENYVVSSYLRLHEERKEILQDIKARGMSMDDVSSYHRALFRTH